jgi:serine/threonine-protein kinase
VIGRYAIAHEIACGGMARVHLGRLLGPAGFSRTVAIKRLHPQFAKNPEFVSMFLDEARLAARIRHPNVVATLDVVAREGELLLVMDYVEGESMSRLLSLGWSEERRVPVLHGLAIVAGVLHGLHAAHEARNERGDALELVHRDISPQNILVGVDGVPRVVDFGVAKAIGRAQTTRDGQIKGKLAYMSPEQLTAQPVDRRSDIYAASVVLWEILAGRRLFDSEHEIAAFYLALAREIEPPSRFAPDLPAGLDAIVLRGLSRRRDDRFATASEMAIALEQFAPFPTAREIGQWVQETARAELTIRAERVAAIEGISEITSPAGKEGEDDALETSVRRPETATVAIPPAASADASTPADVTRFMRPAARRGRVAIAIAIALLGGLAVWRASRTPPADALPELGKVDSSAAAASAAQERAATAESGSTAPAEGAPVNALPAPSAAVDSAPAPARSHASGRRAQGSAMPRPSPTPAPAREPAARSHCNPPYTITPDGVRAYKTECLH